LGTPIWQEHTLLTQDLRLAWYEAGSGPPVVFLNGGPGDTHRYMRAAVEPLTAELHCVLYDQRGCGQSQLGRLDEQTLHVDRFVGDLEALRRHLGLERLRLVGHSWGATLALLYAIVHPGQVDRLVLVGMGPISDDLEAVATANLLKPLSAAERAERATLRLQVRSALAAGDDAGVRALRAREASLHFRAWFASPEALQRFLPDYLADNPPNRRVNALAWTCYKQLRSGLRYERVSAPVLIIYGYQDFEPITQAYVLRERMPQAQICFLNECGHVPWLECPEEFYRAVRTFLCDSGSEVSA
jgi:proline iminopeptidase